MYAVIDAAIERGIYVIVDWHAHDAIDREEMAIEFFNRLILFAAVFFIIVVPTISRGEEQILDFAAVIDIQEDG